jgi:HEAT repeat protein
MRALLFSTMVLTLLVACSKPTDPAKADYWVARLGDKAERTEALKQLGKIGDKTAVPEVLALFKQKGEWQPDAANTLGQLGDASVVPELVKALDMTVGSSTDRAGRLRTRLNIAVLRALGQLEATSATQDVVKFLQAGESTLREAAIRSLGDIGDPGGVEPLSKIAKTDREPFLRKIAIEALGHLGDPRAIPTLIDMLYIEMPGVSFYYEARHSLIQMGRAAVPDLIKTLERKNTSVEGIRLLNGDKIGEGAIVAKAASVLGYLHAMEAEATIIKVVGDLYQRYEKDPEERFFASVPGAIIEMCYSLGNYGTPAAAKGVMPVTTAREIPVRLAAIEAITQIGDRSMIKPLLAAAKKGNKDARAAAIVAISRLGQPEDLKDYDALAKAGDKEVPAADMAEIVKAERVRLTAAQECKKDASCWRQKLKDQDTRVRDKAAWELGWIGNKDANVDLIAALDDDDGGVRMAAVMSLSRIGGADVEELQAVHSRYASKLEWAGINQELGRLIARLRSEQRKK